MVKVPHGRPLAWLAVLAFPMLLSGCFAMQQDLDPIRSDVAVLEKQFVDMQGDVTRLKRGSAEVQEPTGQAGGPPADYQSRLAALERRMDALEAKLGEQGAAAPVPQPMPPEPVEITPLEEAPRAPEPIPAAPAPKSEELSYDDSRKAFESGDYKKAADGFNGFLARHAADDKAPEALYYLGVSYEKMGQTDKAREAFTRLMDNYPFSDAAKMARPRLERKQ